MFNFHQKRKIRRFLYSPLTLVPLAIVVFFLWSSVWNVYTKERETRVKREMKTAELHLLKTSTASLEAEIERLSNERGKEEEIRSKFEVARENEHVVVIVDPKSDEDIPELKEKVSLWRKFLDWL